MLKKLLVLLLVTSLLGCEKKTQKVGCGMQECTLSYAMLSVQFNDKNGSPVTVQNLTAINQRTKQSVLPQHQSAVNQTGQYTITDDGQKDKFSTDGDDVLVSATNPATGQTKTATFKISGGCNCHIAKLSGPALITFD